VRCAIRNNNNPNNRNDNIGFRVCVSHTFLRLPEMRFGHDWNAEALREMARELPWLSVRKAEYIKRPAAWTQVPRQAAFLLSAALTSP
jgi:hypothetical protein